MNDSEISGLLIDAGYRYEGANGRYHNNDSSGDESISEDFATEDVADELNIPVADLLRWEERNSGPAAS